MTHATENKMGCCALSGVPVYEVLTARDGTPTKIGPPLPCGHFAYLLQMDGKIMRIAIHEDCLDEVVSNLGTIWHNIMKAFETEEIRAKAAVTLNIANPQQVAQKFKDMKQLVENRPIGVYCTERIIDCGQRDKAKRAH